MKMQVLLCAVLSGPAAAEMVMCDLSGVAVQFEIDRTQFAPALDVAEPQRRRITTVQMGDAQFTAEPILMDDVRGFWAVDFASADVMLVMQADGSAVYADGRPGKRLTGTCEVLQ